jgi:transcription-repair coupling factor (superfamily II helicase)
MSLKHIYAGVPEGAEALVLSRVLAGESALYVCATESKAQRLVEQLAIAAPQINPLYFPAWDCLPYDRVASGLDVMTMRINVLTTLLEEKQTYCVVTSIASLLQRLPPKSALAGQSLSIQPKQSLSRDLLLSYLGTMGYVRSETVRESGEYAVRGGIIDFFPTGSLDPVRVDFFGDEVESLRTFDAMAQTTLNKLESVILRPVSELTLNSEGISHFRTQYRELFGVSSDPLYEAISAGRKYGGMEHWLPLFFPECDTLLDYAQNSQIFIEEGADGSAAARLQTINDYYQARTAPIPGDHSSPYRPLPPELLYWTAQEWKTFLQTTPWTKVTSFQGEDSQPGVGVEDYQGKVLTDFGK